MLTLERVSKPREFTYEESLYSPLRVEFQPNVLSMDEIFYWRSTAKDFLLEIKISASTGALAELNLVLIPESRIVHKDILPEFSDLGRTKGLPCVGLQFWKDRIKGKETGIDPAFRIYDECCPFIFISAKNGCSIIFDGYTFSRVIESYGASFYFDSENHLCGFELLHQSVKSKIF